MNEITYAKNLFETEPNLLELQVWEQKTAEYFEAKGYAVCKVDDSWWITDESRYPD